MTVKDVIWIILVFVLLGVISVVAMVYVLTELFFK